MMSSDADNAELAELLALLCDGEIGAAEWERLESLLLDDPAAQQLYRRFMALDVELAWRAAGRPAPSRFGPSASAPISPIVIQASPALYAPTSTFYPLGSFAFSYAAAVVIVGIGLLIGWAYQVSIPRSDRQEAATVDPRVAPGAFHPDSEVAFVGRVTDMTDCRWIDPSTEPFNGARVPLGRKYALAAGLMEITYDDGARVILEGPCTYQVESKSSGYLSLGRLTAKVEKRGEGRGKREENLANRQFVNGNPRHPSPLSPPPSPLFSVRTPTAVVTDLGTEFGVEYDKSGVTRSLVFRGSVALQAASADGMLQGSARVLHENQSACVEKTGVITGGAGLEVALGPSAKPGDFVRKMPKRTITVIDLVDVVAGGDGFSGRRSGGINPANGQVVGVLLHRMFTSDGMYHRVAGLPFVDGVFIPKGRGAAVQLDSAGHTFAEFNNSEDKTGGTVCAGGKLRFVPPLPPPNENLRDVPAVLAGVDYSLPPRGMLFLHANKGVTFDLEAIRQANRGCKLLWFRAMTGNTEVHSRLLGGSNSADLWVFLDGRECFKRKNINGYSGATPAAIPISERNRFLTLVGTDGGDGVGADWIVFGDPRLEMIGDAKHSPDLAPNPSQPITPKGEEVHRK